MQVFTRLTVNSMQLNLNTFIMETKEHQLNAEIMSLTEQIKLQYPEVYRNLNEMPITIPNMATPEVKIKQLEDYVQSLKALLNIQTDISNFKS